MREVDRATFYADLGRDGFRYGTGMQPVLTAWFGVDRAAARLELPPASGESKALGARTAVLIDGALQVALYLAQRRGKGGMPFLIEDVQMLGRLDARCLVSVEAGDRDTVRVVLSDELGNVRAIFGRVSFKGGAALPARREQAPSREEVVSHQPAADARDGAPIHFLTTRWQRAALGVVTDGTQEKTLVVHGPALGDVAQRLSRRLGRASCIKTDSAGLASLARPDVLQGVDRIYFLLAQPGAEIATADAERFERECALVLLDAIRHLASAAARPLRVHVIVADDLACGAAMSPWAAALEGFVACVRREFVRWKFHTANVPLGELRRSDPTASSSLDAVWFPADADSSIVFRAGECFAKSVYAVTPDTGDAGALKERGRYVIFGGAGGIGAALASHLASKYSARVVIVGRSPADEHRTRLIAQIAQAGGEGIYVQADVTRADDVKRALDASVGAFGGIDGIFFSAIVLKDGASHAMADADFAAVARTKISGAVHLFEAVRSRELDFVAFFSSILALRGNPGQANYVAGCAFQDALAHYWDARSAFPVRTLNWGYWGDSGIVSGEAYRARLGAQGLESLSRVEGLDAIERVLAATHRQLVVFKGDARILAEVGCKASARVVAVAERGEPFFGICRADAAALDCVATDSVTAFRRGYAALTRHAGLLLLDVFSRMNALPLRSEAIDAEALMKRARIQPRYGKLFRAGLEILARAGYVESVEGTVRGTPALGAASTTPLLEDLRSAESALVASCEALGGHASLLRRCIDSYPGILRGEVAPTEIIFPGASMDHVARVYRDNPSADYFNGIVAEAVRAYVTAAAKRGQAKVQILEIGAGTGGTSETVFRHVEEMGAHVAYTYTDVSLGFTNYGRRRFSRYEFVDYRVLDVGKDPRAQGFGRFDLVLATNVLHATPSIARTLANVATLLKAGGALVLNEMTAVQDILTSIFGLLDGWWLAEDVQVRLPSSPLLSVDSWRAALDAAGLPRMLPFGERASLGQTVMVAEYAGEMLESQPLTSQVERRPNPTTSLPGQEERGAAISSSARMPEAGRKPADHEDALAHIEDVVRARTATVLGIVPDEIDPGRAFSDYGVDSIIGLELVNLLNEALGCDISKTALFDYTNVTDLAAHIQSVGGTAREAAPVERQMAPGDGDADADATAIEDVVRGKTATVLGIAPDEIDAGRAFSDYGVDSIIGLELVNLLNEALGCDISKTALFDYTNVTDLASHIQGAGGRPATPRRSPRAEGPTERHEEDAVAATEQVVVEMVARVLGVSADGVERTRPFSEYGVDSILGLELVNLLNDRLGTELSKTILFDYSTVGDLAAKIAPIRGATSVGASGPNDGPTPSGARTTDSPDPRASGRQLLLKGARLEGEEACQLTVTVAGNNCIRDHVIYDNFIMPTDAYMEMTYLAARDVLGLGAAGVRLSQVSLGLPLVLTESERADVKVSFTRPATHIAFAV